MHITNIVDPSARPLVDRLKEEVLKEIGGQLISEIEADDSTREEWLSRNEEWIKLATQVMEHKNSPWPGASNVKYPLLTMAAMQFASRAYPALIKGNNVVRTIPIGFDPTGQKMQQSIRINKHMSYQLLYQMRDWEEHMDRMLLALPIIGTTFKKSYYDPYERTNVSEYVDARDLIVDYYAKSLRNARRKTHVIYLSENEIIEKQRAGIFAEVDLGSPSHKMRRDSDDETQGFNPPSMRGDEMEPFELYECHCWLDLDEDGLKEPYIVTLLSNNSEVLRIVPRYSYEDIIFNDSNKVAKVNSREYFTNYIFIPDPNSGVYGLGFGTLLGPLNEAINTLINQLIDAGTLNNSTSGFLGRGIKLRSGDARFKPNEWKFTNSTGDDLRKGIFPLPTKEPSNVLFLLLGTLIESGQRLSSTMDIMVGESPGQNQPAQTTMAVMEQGLKVFTSIHKRIFRSFSEELRKLFQLNAEYLDDTEYFVILDVPGTPTEAIGRSDYNTSNHDVLPAGDPNIVTQAQQLVKAQGLLQLMASGLPLNPDEVRRRILEAQEQPAIDQLLQVPPPQPDFETQLKMEEFKWKKEKESKELDLDAQRIASEAIKDENQAVLSDVKARATIKEIGLEEQELKLDTFSKIAENTLAVKESNKPQNKKES